MSLEVSLNIFFLILNSSIEEQKHAPTIGYQMKEEDIIKKRKLLWSKKSPNPSTTSDTKSIEKNPIQRDLKECSEIDSASRFRRLLGVRDSGDELLFKKQYDASEAPKESITSNLEIQYEKARFNSHVNRGSGLGRN
ncbi:MAG: Small acidic protein [Marteilia pararefringens]